MSDLQQQDSIAPNERPQAQSLRGAQFHAKQALLLLRQGRQGPLGLHAATVGRLVRAQRLICKSLAHLEEVRR